MNKEKPAWECNFRWVTQEDILKLDTFEINKEIQPYTGLGSGI